MHIPDGLISHPINIGCAVASAAGLAYSLKRTQEQLDERQIPLLGLTASFVFAAQMLNFPVAAGVSGHFLGGLFAALMLGPWSGFLVLSLVLITQALVFADGGLVAMGTNIFNLAFLGSCVGGWIFGALFKTLPKSRLSFLACAGFCAWLSVMLAAAACALEIAYSPGGHQISSKVIFGAMLGTHFVIGLGEALITVSVLSLVLKQRPDLIHAWSNQQQLSPVPDAKLSPKALTANA